MIEWLLKLFNRKCKHPDRYQRGRWIAGGLPEGIHAYECRLCGELYTTKKVIKFVKKDVE